MTAPTVRRRSALGQIELGQVLPDLESAPDQFLIRLWERPLGILHVAEPMRPDELAERIWARFGHLVQRALVDGGARPIEGLTADGVSASSVPSWLERRREIASSGPPVSIVVCTRDRPEMLDGALQSLLDLEYHDFEIIVVDNSPGCAATARVVESWNTGHIDVRRISEPRPGISWARNAGVRAVDRSIVAFTDDDVIVDRHWLSELVRGFDTAPKVACVTGQILPFSLATDPDRWRESYAGAAKLGFDRKVFDAVSGGSSGVYPFATGECGYGMNMAFRRDMLDDLGGFEEALGVGTPCGGGEDLAVFFQMITSGYRLVYEPSALVSHMHRASYPELALQMATWGRGLTAYLTHAITTNPLMAARLLGRSSAGVRSILSPRSVKNRTKPMDYPMSLTWVELSSMPAGPFAYVRSRRQKARLMRGLGV